jgi:hypothetical protein
LLLWKVTPKLWFAIILSLVVKWILSNKTMFVYGFRIPEDLWQRRLSCLHLLCQLYHCLLIWLNK